MNVSNDTQTIKLYLPQAQAALPMENDTPLEKTSKKVVSLIKKVHEQDRNIAEYGQFLEFNDIMAKVKKENPTLSPEEIFQKAIDIRLSKELHKTEEQYKSTQELSKLSEKEINSRSVFGYGS